MEMERARPNARRRRIPAFGEWNHAGDGNGDGGWPASITPFFDLAGARKPPEMEGRYGDGVAAGMRRTVEPPHCRRRSKVADSTTCAARKSCFTVVKAVDDDLYGVPPDMLYQKPAMKGGWLKILLARCFCPRGMA